MNIGTLREQAEQIEQQIARNKRIEARRFTGEPITGFGALLPTDNLVERICEIWNLDYTPEEIAIEAQERAQAEEAQEREDRAERLALDEAGYGRGRF